MTKITIKQAKETVARLGFKLKKNEYGEYVLRGYGCEYFGGSLEDAVETAHVIVGLSQVVSA